MSNKKIPFMFSITVIFLLCKICLGTEADLIQPSTTHPSIWEFLLYLLVFGASGIVMLIGGYYLWELITPYSVKKQLIEHKNSAVAIVVAAFIVGMAIIIGSSLILIK